MKRVKNSTKQAVFIIVVVTAVLLLGACSVPVFPTSDSSTPKPTPPLRTVYGTGELNFKNWTNILLEVQNHPDPLVELDLSACEIDTSLSLGPSSSLDLDQATSSVLFYWTQEFSGNKPESIEWVVFDPKSATPEMEKGKNKIARLILPNEATLIPDGTYGADRQNSTPGTVGYGMWNITIKIPTFYHFNALKSVTGRKVTQIGKCAFAQLQALERVEFPEVGHRLRDWELATTYAIVTTDPSLGIVGYEQRDINTAAFYKCTALKEVIIPKARLIGNSAFFGCTSLRSVKFDDVWMVYEHAFEKCSGLTQVDFPALTKICNYAFRDCTSLTSVSLGSVTVDPRDRPNLPTLPRGDCGNKGNGTNGPQDLLYKYSVVIFDGAFSGCRALRTVDIRYAWNVHFGTHAFGDVGETLDIWLSDDSRHSLNDHRCFGYDIVDPIIIPKVTTITLKTITFHVPSPQTYLKTIQNDIKNFWDNTEWFDQTIKPRITLLPVLS